ncbi:hypothetical protein A6U86_27425 [Rhizobium sp. AC27/96]|uniref:hypothetical protein n=1 Tax=Rhizobium sp. AC27/96 TaxID=1841653 RepID=UPI0008289D85|nr:hypothetical protein [Rhizobium sp. AC27/96]OCJ08648.1 hypothetical protein A6U86_27425 [Rhizobium sp. AC27/96]
MNAPMKACWRVDDATAIISNEALEGHEGVFLATHSPITDFDISGSHGGEIDGRNEAALLDVLSDSVRRHAFCVVQGEPGSGKSHLIRWLSINWPRNNDVKLLLQRADGSLEGALGQMRERLPVEFKDLFDKMGQRHRATDRGRANLLLSNLANALHPDHFDPPLEDAEWCRTVRPGDLIDLPAIKHNWQGPARILALMEGKGSGEDSERNSQSASFDAFDIEELAKHCGAVFNSGVMGQTERLARKLIDEAALIADLREAGWTADEIAAEQSLQIPTSMKLVGALNRRRNDAVQNLLGVSAEGLKKLFRQIRVALAERGQRLVLLLEDITSWEGIDDSLIDVLVTNAETRGADGASDMCPLISVVGVTPGYYKKLHGNYRARITHEINLGSAQQDGELQDVATLRNADDRLGFVSRYLSAVRAGPVALSKWREDLWLDSAVMPPNRCDNCDARARCHATFGAVDGVGLYPFTQTALDHFFDALNDRDNGMTWKTPRGMLQAVLSPNLLQAKAINEGQFPTGLTENAALVAESRNLGRRVSAVLTNQLSEHPTELARTRRIIAYWGDKERADTVADEAGDLHFAGVSKSVFEAFSLPWIGLKEGSDIAQPPATVQAVAPAAAIVHENISETVPAKDPMVRAILTQPAPTQTRTPQPPSAKKLIAKSDLRTRLDEIRSWEINGEPQTPTVYNSAVFHILSEIDPRRVGLDPYTKKRILTEQQVKIEGTGPPQRAYLTIPREEWLWRGLEAVVSLQLDRGMSFDDIAFHRHSLTVLTTRLEGLLSDYADRRLGKINEERWNPIPIVTQILVARAWLRGTVNPDDPHFLQLRGILSEEPPVESDPATRCAPWQEFLNRTRSHHDTLRDALRAMISMPQGGSPGFGLADVSSVAGAIARLRQTLRFDETPSGSFDTNVSEFDTIREIVSHFKNSLGQITRIERQQLESRATSLQDLLRGRTIQAHLMRVDQVITSVANLLPRANPESVTTWKSEYGRARARIELAADQSAEDFMVLVAEHRDASTALGLAQLSQAPSKDLGIFLDAAKLGDQVASQLLGHVKDCINDGRGSFSLGQVNDVGHIIAQVLKQQGKRDD